ncbi:hypothetical protein SAMN05443377_11827 [Propionibacterium cyclohexanicum]|uniref:Pyrimidine dimer DNA glycosylase /DNA-(Apurinic or apyrimidinic site) lyase n=2 Tax=Propionibacterium cyclohexanicum TaxID=64702 RepID=A0A1H9T393_9ACTN|nr:hypothetical protein SAMN05443377_11827 [Propionibacterium cyclohexanicum]
MWSLHPQYLDRQGLLGCWRESLLAQAVLAGRTKGYRAHPQLQRFSAQAEPLVALAAYLAGLADEGDRRGYHLDRTRIIESPPGSVGFMTVTREQLLFEAGHLRAKLIERSPGAAAAFAGLDEHQIEPHPSFRIVEGPIAPWERAAG